MKKNLLTFLILTLMSVFVADAAKIYFQNTKNWSQVYAYTWAPSDEPTLLDALSTVTVKDENGGDMTLYVKETNKDNVIFLDKPSFLNSKKQQTVQFAVEDNAVYTGNDTKIGEVSEKDGVLTFIAKTPTEYNSGVVLMYGSLSTSSIEFVKSGSIYTVNSIILAGGKVRILLKNEDGEDVQVGPLDNESPSRGTTVSNVGFNSNIWTPDPAGYCFDVIYDAANNTVTFKQLPVDFWAAYRSDNGVWGTPFKLTRVDPSTAVCKNTFDASSDSQFAIFRTYGNQSWDAGDRMMPVGAANVTGDFTGKFTEGNSSVWLLDNEVPFGTWTLDLVYADRTVSFTRNVQAIIVNGTPAELTDGSWSGTLAEDDVVDFNIDGTYYVLGELTQKQEGTNLIYTTTLVEGRDKEIGFSAEDATVTVDGLNATITATGAFKPQMTVGSKTIDLAQSGKFLVAYDVNITNDDAISFSIDGKNYVPDMPETIAYEAFSVTIPLKEEEGSATFADVKNAGGKTSFITDTFTPNIRVAADASAVTFVWDAQTAVEAIEAEAAVDAVYYNLQGIRVENPVNGLYVKVVNGKASKVKM